MLSFVTENNWSLISDYKQGFDSGTKRSQVPRGSGWLALQIWFALVQIYGSQRLRRLEDGLLQRCGHPNSDGVKPEIFLCALLDASSVEARAASISSSSVMFVLQRCLGVSFSACRVGGPGSPVLVNLGFSLVCLLCRLVFSLLAARGGLRWWWFGSSRRVFVAARWWVISGLLRLRP